MLKVLPVVLASVAVTVGVAAAASSPGVVTLGPSAITDSSATLNGTVNPNGNATTYLFQWGLTTSYGLQSSSHSAGHGIKPVSVHVTATDLIPGTLYHYHVVASNKFGASVGADRTFKTTGHPPPDVATGPANGIGTSGATLTGVVNPHGQATTWTFEYGLSAFYGYLMAYRSVPAGSSPVTVTSQLQGLEPGTTFHYRLVASHNGSVQIPGADQSFMTLPSPRPIPRLPATTTPHRDRSRPFAFTTYATVVGPASTPSSLDCNGVAAIRFLVGRRIVAFTLAPVQPNCTISTRTIFDFLPTRNKKRRQVHLRVVIHFRGNDYLAPADARPETITAG
jgi:hypothetical protein